MADMTMGQRIAQRRKLLGLSQEALGEKLGVSRQAISKWEADGTIPEIDKLIAMSKLFGVTVGWLLGTEDASEKVQTEGFSEAQLKIVEEIVQRYSQPPRKGRFLKTVLVAVLCVIAVSIVVSLIFGYCVKTEMAGINGQISYLYNFYYDINGKLGVVYNSLEELAAGERMLREYALEAKGHQDLAAATVTFSATPREIRPGDQAWFCVYMNAETVAKVQCTSDGTVYLAAVDLPAVDGYSYYYQVIHSNGDSSQEPLTETFGCDELGTGLRGFFVEHTSRSTIGQDRVNFYELSLTYKLPKLPVDGDGMEIMDLTLVVFYDGATQLRIPLIQEGEVVESGEYMSSGVIVTMNEFSGDVEIPCEWVAGREVTLSVEAVFSTGQRMEQTLRRWCYHEENVEVERISPLK